MANDTTKKSLFNAFQELPEKIRDWLTSERVTYTIIEINKRFAFFGEDLKIIPRLVARLVLKDLAPENFIKELVEQLSIDQNTAEAIAQDIFQRILRPIDLSLKEIQVFPVLILEKRTGISVGPKVEQTIPIKPASLPSEQLTPAAQLTMPPKPSASPTNPPVVKIPINVTAPKPPLPPIQNKNLESNN